MHIYTNDVTLMILRVLLLILFQFHLIVELFQKQSQFNFFLVKQSNILIKVTKGQTAFFHLLIIYIFNYSLLLLSN